MCKATTYKKRPNARIDFCIRNLIRAINNSPFIVTMASCCGHGVYPLTIVVKDLTSKRIYELLTDTTIPRTRNFYKHDGNGLYFIPEVTEPTAE